MKKVLIAIGILVILVVGWLIISRTGDHQSMSSAKKITTERVPDFALQDYSGKTVSLADFAGKPVVINTWASWCPFCVDELPDFVKLQKEFGDKLVVIAVNRAESPEVSLPYAIRVGAFGNMILLQDPSDSFYQSIGGFSMPETIFVDKEGFIRDHKRGPIPFEEMKRRAEQAFGI